MSKYRFLIGSLMAVAFLMTLASCGGDGTEDDGTSTENDFAALLDNQINNVIIPTMEAYEASTADLVVAADGFSNNTNEETLATLRAAFRDAYSTYQAVAVHEYFINSNLSVVSTTNLYPIDTVLLSQFIADESYNFNSNSQQRATGFPALDFMLYNSQDVVSYFEEDQKRMSFMLELVSFIDSKATDLVEQWSAENLIDGFINSGGTGLGSSISAQLNGSLVYYETDIRENKIGIPIGRLGPNDSPIEEDPQKIEAYYQSQFAGNEDFTLSLVRMAIDEMENIYIGRGQNNQNGQGYDDLLIARGDEGAAIDTDIKSQFDIIYAEIENRTGISGNDDLYTKVQRLVTLYKSDMFPILNIQDADGANDGD